MKSLRKFGIIVLVITNIILIGCTNHKINNNGNKIIEEDTVQNQTVNVKNGEEDTFIVKYVEEEDNTKEATSRSDNKLVLYEELEVVEGSNNSEINGYIYAVDRKGNRKWKRSWRKLPRNKFKPMSKVIETENGIIYIEVNGELYAMDKLSGEILWGNVPVGGNAIMAIDKDGIIYCTAYSKAFLSAISPDGKIKWSVDFTNMHNSKALFLTDTEVHVVYGKYDDNNGTYYEEGEAVFTKEGVLIDERVIN